MKVVESKFHEGEWITNGDYTWKIVKVEPLDYILQSQEGNIVDDTISHVDKQFHSFTIEDAKTGDVLTTDMVHFIFKSNDDLHCNMYCHYSVASNKFDISDTAIVDSKYVHPATKEQRNLLFQKMKEAKYEWNANKKELKKIESKFKVGDEIKATNKESQIITKIDEKGYWSNELFICGFDEECIWDLVEQKPAWSNDDENILNAITYTVKNSGYKHCIGVSNEVMIDWLKHIKERITSM